MNNQSRIHLDFISLSLSFCWVSDWVTIGFVSCCLLLLPLNNRVYNWGHVLLQLDILVLMPDSVRCSCCLCKPRAAASHHNTHTPRYALRIRPVVIISVNCFQSACIHPHHTYARHVETFLCHTPVAATTTTTTTTTGWVVIVATSRLDLPASQLTNEAPSKRQQNYLYAVSTPSLCRGGPWQGAARERPGCVNKWLPSC